jgi:hypothetical protein
MPSVNKVPKAYSIGLAEAAEVINSIGCDILAGLYKGGCTIGILKKIYRKFVKNLVV